MKPNQRIYLVTQGATARLVRATTPAVARSHVARTEFEVRVATQDDIVMAITDGSIVEETTEGPVQKELGEVAA